MKTLVIYDSAFGNTEKIAQAIGKALGSSTDVGILRVTNVKPEQLTGLKLLIIGSPTRAFSPTPATNKLIATIPRNGLKGIKVAAFDTRILIDDVDARILPPLMKTFGYAAKPIANKLRKKGGELIVPPEGFFVDGTEGPLKDGELERAANWAKKIKTTQ